MKSEPLLKWRTRTARNTAQAAFIFWVVGGVLLISGWLAHYSWLYGIGIVSLVCGATGYGAALLEDRERPGGPFK